MLGFGEEVWQLALVELRLSDHTTLKEVLAGPIEGSVKESEERKSILCEDLLVEVCDLARDVHALEDRFGGGHINFVDCRRIVSCWREESVVRVGGCVDLYVANTSDERD